MDRLERPDDEMGMTIGWIQVEEGQLPYRSASGHILYMKWIIMGSFQKSLDSQKWI